MDKYFDIFIEFDKYLIDKIILESISFKKKGYVCVVDGNVLANTYVNDEYKGIINNAVVNLCDGSSIALLAGILHHKRFDSYTGPEIFSKLTKTKYRQYFIGNTEENLNRLKTMFTTLGYKVDQFKFEYLPFRNVNDFDFPTIAESINEFSPDIIWVSLGAPKQEIFISKLYPFINRGILFAIGAAFTLFLGNKQNKRAPELLRRMHLLWLIRLMHEPRKVGKRALNYLVLLPVLVLDEIKRTKNIK
jgi:N-acetylglucosaminyldiphosphoundecaprenol N-acetyl-beta-D-mannosaminyltransferase